MMIDWPTFLPALLLLLFPANLVYGDKIRYRDIARDMDGYGVGVLLHGQHYIDLARAALGTWLLVDSLHQTPGLHGLAGRAVLIAQCSIRMVAVLVQMFACRERDSLNAPFAFVIGIVLTGASPLVGLLAVTLAVPVALGSRTLFAFFPILALSYLGIALVLLPLREAMNVSPGVAVTILAWLIPMLLDRSSVIAYRKKRLVEGARREPAR